MPNIRKTDKLIFSAANDMWLKIFSHGFLLLNVELAQCECFCQLLMIFDKSVEWL
jgi:hypothetical protein